MKNEEGGDLGKVFNNLIQEKRPSNHGYDVQLLQKDVEALYKVTQNQYTSSICKL
jgi:hypothetical protein